MDKNKLLSIIVPIYKAEVYLSKCIDSILAQTYKNLELILVDDGSPDKCPEICDDYARKDERVIVIHKQNGGVASARNYGLIEAKGSYIGFVDSDDFIEKDMYETLISEIENTKEPISCVSCGIFRYIGESRCILEQQKGMLNSESMINDLLSDKLFPVIYNKIFRRSCIGNIKFDETLRSGEDLLFLFDCASQMEKERSFLKSIDQVFYNYRLAEGSLSLNRANYYYSMLAINKIAENICINSSNFILAQKRAFSYSVIGAYASFIAGKHHMRHNKTKLEKDQINELMRLWGFRHKLLYLLATYLPCLLRFEPIFSFCTRNGEVPPYC